MNIVIIGAGNTGKAWAGLLSSQGEEVTLVTRSSEKCQRIREQGISLQGATEAKTWPACTTELADAISEAELILISTTSDAHRSVAEALQPIVKPGQNILILNGNWGCYEFLEVFGEDVFEQPVNIAETNSMMLIAAALDDNTVDLKRIKESVGVAYLQRGTSDVIEDFLSERFSEVEILDSVIESSINNANPIIHVPIALMNLARIDLAQPFYFYPEGASARAIDFVEQIDQERVAVVEALGLTGVGILDIINSFWPDKHATLYDAIQQNASYQKVLAPTSVEHRFFTEDLPYGLEPILDLANQLGLETPGLQALLAFAKVIGVSSNPLNVQLAMVNTIIERRQA